MKLNEVTQDRKVVPKEIRKLFLMLQQELEDKDYYTSITLEDLTDYVIQVIRFSRNEEHATAGPAHPDGGAVAYSSSPIIGYTNLLVGFDDHTGKYQHTGFSADQPNVVTHVMNWLRTHQPDGRWPDEAE